MKKFAVSVIANALLILIWVSSASAKGSPDLIVVKDAKASINVEIRDPQILKAFDPWNGQFINWKADSADEAALTPADPNNYLDVSFFMKWPERRSAFDRGNLKLAYTLRYSPGPDGEPGFIYLPGRNDKLYNINAGTIYREGHDGHWRRASASWTALMSRLINGKKVQAGPVAKAFNLSIITILAMALIASAPLLIYGRRAIFGKTSWRPPVDQQI